MVNKLTNTSSVPIQPTKDEQIKYEPKIEQTKKEQIKPEHKEKDNNDISKESQNKTKAETFISLGFDSAKPSTDLKIDNRFGNRPREISLPLSSTSPNFTSLNNPILFANIRDNPTGKGIILKNSPTSPELNFASIDAPTQAVASLFDDLSKRFPNIEKNVLYRLSKIATYIAIDIPLMVASHEMGHAGASKTSAPDSSPNVVVAGWMNGFTQYNKPESFTPTEQEKIFRSLAGMNQATFNGEQISRKMHTKGADISDAIQYLVNVTNSANYQVKDWIKNSPPGFNDGATYHKMMEDRNKGWNQENLSTLAVGANLLNTDFWASLIGGVNYAVTGEQVKMPEIKAGGVNFSLPSFSVINTYEGPQINTSLYANKGGKSTFEMKYSTILTPDNGASMGLEARLHNFSVPYTNDSLTVSPVIGVSVADKLAGYKAGGIIDYRPSNNRYISLSADVSYRNNYMPDKYQPDTGSTGFSGILGANLSFP